MTPTTYTVTIGQLTRELPSIRVGEVGWLPLVELLGDVEFTNAVADALVEQVPEGTEAFLTVSTSSIPLAHALSERTGIPYEVARKKRRTYMRDPLIQEVRSMTLGMPETLWLDARHAERLRDKRVTTLIDVVFTGGTSEALARLVERAGGKLHGHLSAFRQGEPQVEVRYLHELPPVL